LWRDGFAEIQKLWEAMVKGWSMMHMVRLALLCLAASLATGRVARCEGKPRRHNVMAHGYYVREETDRVWHLKLVGKIPSLSGAYIVIHNVEGKIIHHGPIPHGEFTQAKPYTVAIPKDGITGDYRMIMVGQQGDMLGVMIPWTDLPLEVYGGSSFSVGHDKGVKPIFKAPAGVTKMSLGAYKGHLKVRDAEGKVVADTEVNGKSGSKRYRYDKMITFAVTPGATYTIERRCFYFRSYIPGTCYLTASPERWFKPSSELDKIKWWELIK
jgi:hypothetical protein